MTFGVLIAMKESGTVILSTVIALISKMSVFDVVCHDSHFIDGF